MAGDMELLFETECHDGFAGDMAAVTILFDPGDNRTVCKCSSGTFTIDREVDAASAKWRVLNSPAHRNLAVNKFFVNAPKA